mgnify:CR=1 FL=1|tara:strand:+ start:43 stop:582 length:540 start_codon:yes stop_codon:yes gene_type:complete
MPNTDVTSKKASTIPANNEIGRGYTRQVSITFQDFLDNEPAGSNDNDTQTYELFDLPVGSYLRGVYFFLRTAFDDSGGGSALGMEIGDTTDPNGILVSKEIHVDGSEIIAGTQDGVFFNTTGTNNANTDVLNAKVYTTANTVEALFTPGGSGSAYKLSELTQGEIVFVADIVYANLAQS